MQENKQIMKQLTALLDSLDESYDETYPNQTLSLGIYTSNGIFDKILVSIHVTEGGYSMFAYPLIIPITDVKVKKELCELLIRINSQIFYGSFCFNYNTGEIYYERNQFCCNTLPDRAQIEVNLMKLFGFIKHYAPAINKVISDGGTADEGIAELSGLIMAT